MKTALFIGRFQPFHNGHLATIERIIEENDAVIIGIGSSQYSHTFDNPFTAKERAEMIEKSLANKVKYSISLIPDIHNYRNWVDHVISIVPRFDTVYVGNNNATKQLFEEKGYNVKTIKINQKQNNINATMIRNAILNNEPYAHLIPQSTIDVLVSIDAVSRIKSAANLKPTLAVDVIMEIDNKIVLVERKYRPYGWAIPGGKVEYGENVEDTAIREMKEETSLNIYDLELFGVYSDKNRDPRGHTVSIVFKAKARGEAKAGDDAKNLGLFDKDKVPELVFDHKKIIEDYLNRR